MYFKLQFAIWINSNTGPWKIIYMLNFISFTIVIDSFALASQKLLLLLDLVKKSP